ISSNGLFRANNDGADTHTVVAAGPSGSPFGLALDTVDGKVYWTSNPNQLGGFEGIGRANLDGSSPENLLATSTTTTGGIALDLPAGKIFWTDPWPGDIRVANLDGSSAQTLINGLAQPRGIALDLVNGKMYWTDYTAGDVRRANLDGTAAQVVVSAE